MPLTPERRMATLVGVVVLGVVMLGASVVAIFLTVGAQEREVDRARAELRERDRAIAATQRKDRIIAHGQCLTIEDGRRRVRSFAAESVRLTFAATLPDRPPFTTEQRVALDDLEATIRMAGESILPGVDCAVAAPLPKNTTGAERAQLPRSEPIVVPVRGEP